MNKRLRKKVGKYKCLKCGSEDGVRGYTLLKTGKWVCGPLACMYCDLGMDRDWERKRISEILSNRSSP
jgi:hypothetical protein